MGAKTGEKRWCFDVAQNTNRVKKRQKHVKQDPHPTRSEAPTPASITVLVDPQAPTAAAAMASKVAARAARSVSTIVTVISDHICSEQHTGITAAERTASGKLVYVIS